MKQLLIIASLLISTISLGQSSTLNLNSGPTFEQLKSKEYIIGIGNTDDAVFTSVLDFLQNDMNISVNNACYKHHIISFSTINNQYKSYDVVKDLLTNEFKTLLLSRKNNTTIFTKDCSDEYIKQ